MDSNFEAEPLLGRAYQLPDGSRVRLRLARDRDAPGVGALLSDRSDTAEDLHELVHFDPRRRAVVSATTLRDGAEHVVGVGAIDLGATEPDILLVAAGAAETLPDLLRRALVVWSRSIAERRAA